MLTLLAGAALIVPAAQLHDLTTLSLDEHIAYGVWFAAIGAGYASSKFIRWLPAARPQLAALCCAVALAYPAAASWQSAWERYHAWANAGAFINAFESATDRSHGPFYVPGNEAIIARYYTSESIDSVTVLSSAGSADYSAQLRSGNYGVIALFYSTTFSSAPGLPGRILLPRHGISTYQQLLGLVEDNSKEPGLASLTLALEENQEYRRGAVGPYDASDFSGTHDYGIYVIWQKMEQK